MHWWRGVIALAWWVLSTCVSIYPFHFYACLNNRPHGQHSVILAEDAHRYMEFRNERSDMGSAVASSHQIYLTFPADSTFTEEDVAHYFRLWNICQIIYKKICRFFYFYFFLLILMPFIHCYLSQTIWPSSRCEDSEPRQKNVWVCELPLCTDCSWYFDEAESPFYL